MMINPERFKHYKTGNQRADDEHYNVLLLADDLMRSLQNWNENRADVGCDKAIHFLNVLQEHINIEEIFMESTEFPYRQYHCQNHELLLRQIKIAIAHYRDNPVAAILLAHQIHNVSDLILTHIEEHDLQLHTWIKTKEIAYD
jgi:hemerythrin